MTPKHEVYQRWRRLNILCMERNNHSLRSGIKVLDTTERHCLSDFLQTLVIELDNRIHITRAEIEMGA